MKPGIKSTEFIAMILGTIGAVLPVVLDKVPPDSVWAAVLGSVAAAVSYITGRTLLKARQQ